MLNPVCQLDGWHLESEQKQISKSCCEGELR